MTAVPETTAPVTTGRFLWLWLLLIVAVGFGMRWPALRAPLQQDEFPPLYAIAERHADSPDVTPSTADPLLPVRSWREVRERSVLPYGIVNPVPLFHYLLYQTIQVLPIAEWSLRLPSLLAGLACIVVVFFLCRRALGIEMALVAALLVAVDPLQIIVSDLARPYALGNLAIALSFLALFGVVHAESHGRAALAAVGYTLCLTMIGYLQPVLLLVVVAHVGLLVFGVLNPVPGRLRGIALFSWWLAACVLAGLLLSPLWSYIVQVGAFSRDHRDYLFLFGELRLWSVVAHNSTFLIALLIASLAGYVGRQIRQAEGAATIEKKAAADGGAAAVDSPAATVDAATEAPPVDSPELIWVSRAWLFWPQMAALVLAYGLQQALYLSRYLSYTTLGGSIVLAYWATRERFRDLRLGVSAAVVLTVILWGRLSPSAGFGLVSPMPIKQTIAFINVEDDKNLWRPNDVLLVRSGFLEADFLPNRLPEATHQHVIGALVSPYTTLYVSRKPRPIILLSKSMFRNKTMHTAAGTEYDPEPFYNARLAARLRQYDQFWVASNDDADRSEFFACFLPWLADAVDSDLKVARTRFEPEHYFAVYEGSEVSDYLEGLSNIKKDDFNYCVRVQRLRPPWAYRLGGVTDLAPAAGPAGLAVTAWRLSQARTPRLVQEPKNDAE